VTPYYLIVIMTITIDLESNPGQMGQDSDRQGKTWTEWERSGTDTSRNRSANNLRRRPASLEQSSQPFERIPAIVEGCQPSSKDASYLRRMPAIFEGRQPPQKRRGEGQKARSIRMAS